MPVIRSRVGALVWGLVTTAVWTLPFSIVCALFFSALGIFFMDSSQIDGYRLVLAIIYPWPKFFYLILRNSSYSLLNALVLPSAQYIIYAWVIYIFRFFKLKLIAAVITVFMVHVMGMWAIYLF
jgi:hypothetical protein